MKSADETPRPARAPWKAVWFVLSFAVLFASWLAPSPAQASKPHAVVTSTAPLDLNRATAAQLTSLPGIGPKRAAQILAVRAAKPFRSMRDLLRIRGIGPKTIARMRALGAFVGPVPARPKPKVHARDRPGPKPRARSKPRK